MIKYPSLPVRFIVSFISIAVLMIIAAGVFGNTVQSAFFPELNPDGEAIGLLLGGMAVMGLFIAILYPSLNIKVGDGWFQSAARVAVLLGLTIFFATHMIQAGYIKISAAGWLLEGLYDSLAPMGAIIALAWLTNRQNSAQTS